MRVIASWRNHDCAGIPPYGPEVGGHDRPEAHGPPRLPRRRQDFRDARLPRSGLGDGEAHTGAAGAVRSRPAQGVHAGEGRVGPSGCDERGAAHREEGRGARGSGDGLGERAMRTMLTITLSFLLAARLASQGTAEDSVRAAEQARGQALLKADTVALSRLVADEFVEISRLGQIRTRADNIRDIASGDLKLTAVKYDSLVVRIYGEVAVLRGIADNTGTFRGFPFSGKIRYTRVFVRRDGRWQAVAMQQT